MRICQWGWCQPAVGLEETLNPAGGKWAAVEPLLAHCDTRSGSSSLSLPERCCPSEDGRHNKREEARNADRERTINEHVLCLCDELNMNREVYKLSSVGSHRNILVSLWNTAGSFLDAYRMVRRLCRVAFHLFSVLTPRLFLKHLTMSPTRATDPGRTMWWHSGLA